MERQQYRDEDHLSRVELAKVLHLSTKTLDRYRLTEKQKAAVTKELGGDDVSGFAMAYGTSARSTSASSVSSSSMSASQSYADQASSASTSGMLSGSVVNLNVNIFNPDSDFTQ